MQVLIHGAGAMGLYFAARLQQAGHQVHLIARTPWDGAPDVNISTSEGEQTVTLSGVSSSVPQGLKPDLVLIATKAWPVPEVVADLAQHLPASTPIMTLQNGITAPEHSAAAFPHAPIIAGTCVVIVKRTQPGHVHLLGAECQITYGLFRAGEHYQGDALALVKEAFDGTPIPVTATDDVQRALWKKLSLISSYGGVGAVSGLTAGETRSHPQTRSMVHEAIEECRAVANSYDVTFTNEDVEQVFSTYMEHFEPGTTTSMQRDLAQGLPSELDDQVGVIVTRGAEKGVPTPVYSFIYRTQSVREEIAREKLAN